VRQIQMMALLRATTPDKLTLHLGRPSALAKFPLKLYLRLLPEVLPLGKSLEALSTAFPMQHLGHLSIAIRASATILRDGEVITGFKSISLISG